MNAPLCIINYLYYLAVKESQAREEERKEREEAERQEEAKRSRSIPSRSSKRVPYLKDKSTPPVIGRLEAEAFEDEMLGG